MPCARRGPALGAGARSLDPRRRALEIEESRLSRAVKPRRAPRGAESESQRVGIDSRDSCAHICHVGPGTSSM